jgi:demethylmenaquinone methyltransferase/2-methoxy-6-polyprenyl-1,4-benzoquinol methylase
MTANKSIWLSDQKAREKNNEQLNQKKVASFGYRQVPEDEKVDWVIRHFNTVAKRYDVMNTLLSFGIHHLWKRTAVKMTGLNPGDRVLDVCGGTGDLSILAAREVGPSGSVWLYDINWAMIRMGRPKVARSPHGGNIFYVQGDAEQIAFDSQRFDAAMVGFGIRNLTHMPTGFSEMHRVLKPGGKLMCLEFSKPSAPIFRWLYDIYSLHVMPLLGQLIVGSRQAYTYLPESIRMFALPEELTALMEKIGFAQVTHRKLTNGIAVIHLGVKV